MRRSRTRAAALLLALLPALSGWSCGTPVGGSASGKATAPFRGPIVLVSLTALRADAVRGEPSITPRFDRFAAAATWSGTGVAASSWCGGSLASVLTGVSPALHGAGHPGHPWLRAGVRTLAQELQAAGFVTRGYYAIPWLGPGFGLERGFEATRPLHRRFAERRLAGLDGGPSLTWIQLPLPGVSLPPARTAGEAGSAAPRRKHAAVRQKSAAARQKRAAARQTGAPVPTPAPARRDEPEWERAVTAPYRQRVAEADLRLGRLLDGLERSGRYDRAIVIVFADHGQALDAGEALAPGQDIGRASVEVPLAIKLPSELADRIQVPAGAAVGLDRLYATVLELAGLEPLPVVAPSLLRPSAWAALSELWFGNGYHEVGVYEDGHQLRWRCRFAPAAASLDAARREALGPGGSLEYGTLIGALEAQFRARPRCVEGEEIVLEAWPAGGGVAGVDDPARRERMIDRLRSLRSFPPVWAVEAPPPAPALRRHELQALSGWGLPLPAQWAAGAGGE
jgi:hypothetical protein